MDKAPEPDMMNPWEERDVSPADGELLSSLCRALGGLSGASGAIEDNVLFGALAVPSRVIKGALKREPGGSWNASLMSLPSGSLLKLRSPDYELLFYGDAEGTFYTASWTPGIDFEKTVVIHPEVGAGAPSLLISSRTRSSSIALNEAPAGFPWTAAPVHDKPEVKQVQDEAKTAEPVKEARPLQNDMAVRGAPPALPKSHKCLSCGTALTERHRFCPKCGVKVDAPPPQSASLTCRSCGTALTEKNKFCPKCGIKVDAPPPQSASLTCRSCGTALTEKNKFCPKCGVKVDALPPQSAVLSCLSCGMALTERHRFCPKCGVKVDAPPPQSPPAPAQSRCRRCGRPYMAAEKFCKACGEKIPKK